MYVAEGVRLYSLGGSHTDQGVQPADRIAGKGEGLQNNDSCYSDVQTYWTIIHVTYVVYTHHSYMIELCCWIFPRHRPAPGEYTCLIEPPPSRVWSLRHDWWPHLVCERSKVTSTWCHREGQIIRLCRRRCWNPLRARCVCVWGGPLCAITILATCRSIPEIKEKGIWNRDHVNA